MKCQYEFMLALKLFINKDILHLYRTVLYFVNKSVPGEMYKF